MSPGVPGWHHLTPRCPQGSWQSRTCTGSPISKACTRWAGGTPVGTQRCQWGGGRWHVRHRDPRVMLCAGHWGGHAVCCVLCHALCHVPVPCAMFCALCPMPCAIPCVQSQCPVPVPVLSSSATKPSTAPGQSPLQSQAAACPSHKPGTVDTEGPSPSAGAFGGTGGTRRGGEGNNNRRGRFADGGRRGTPQKPSQIVPFAL